LGKRVAVALFFAQENPEAFLATDLEPRWSGNYSQASTNDHQANLEAMILANSLKSLK
jgi:hypothetical protein